MLALWDVPRGVEATLPQDIMALTIARVLCALRVSVGAFSCVTHVIDALGFAQFITFTFEEGGLFESQLRVDARTLPAKVPNKSRESQRDTVTT